MELDKDRLTKLLNLTESEHDGEALAAIRKANELLRFYNTSWAAALGVIPPQNEPASPASPAAEAATRAATPPAPPPRYRRARAYRDAFHREPLLPRLLGFPFWIIVEVIALAAPNMFLNVKGPWLAAVFTLSMMLGIAVWLTLVYSVLVGFG